MFQKNLILLRGLPGSGKSTLAALLSEDGKYPVYSIDQYFTNLVTGEYSFQFDENHLAYKQCELRTEESMIKGESKIFVDNTFIFDWEIEPYILLAKKHSYYVFVLTMEKYHSKPNVHGITDEQIEKMAARFKVKLMI